MTMRQMYPAVTNSPGTELAADITATDTEITVLSASGLPPAPNLLTIGSDETAETVRYTAIEGDVLTVERGFQGVAKAWSAGAKLARNFTAYDHDTFIENIAQGTIDEREDLTLQTGIQIIDSEQDTPFNFGSIEGRTLVNRLGNKGLFESPWTMHAGTTSVSKGVCEYTGNGSAINPQIFTLILGPTPSLGDTFLIRARVKNNNSNNVSEIIANMYSVGSGLSETASVSTPSVGEWYDIVVALDVSQVIIDNWSTMRFVVATRYNSAAASNGAKTEVAAPALYHIPAADKNMASDELLAKYPFVASMTNVTNPYAIATGDNLLPPFTEWAVSSETPITLNEPYSITLTGRDGMVDAAYCRSVPVEPNTMYTYSVTHNGYISVTDADSNVYVDNTTAQTVNFNSGNTTAINVNIYNNKNAGTFTFKNPMLTVGTEAKPFKPQSRSMWAAECQLAANPLDGTNADVLFTGDDGLPYVLEKWGKVTLDGSLPWSYVQSANTGFKIVKVDNITSNFSSTGEIGCKFDGTILTTQDLGSFTAPDLINLNALGHLFVSVSNTDSGWGDAYEPTPDEIKAYFLGWKMYLYGSPTQPYNGTGTKAWGKLGLPLNPDGGLKDGTITLPTQSYPQWNMYRLQYLKAAPTVESIRNYETGLTLCSGSNVVEVGSGIVIREKANPYFWEGANRAYINSGNPNDTNPWETTRLTHKTKDILNTYRNRSVDGFSWERLYGTLAYGNAYLRSKANMYDPTAVYHVTYTMLAPSLSAPINGNVATNLRGTVSDLVQRSGDIEQRLSVVENQKAEKDNTVVWITPALLNGFSAYGGSFILPRYFKDEKGFVHLQGLVKTGSNQASGVYILNLPSGYRPKLQLLFNASGGNTTPFVRIDISGGGNVILQTAITSNDFISLSGITFLAEQ